LMLARSRALAKRPACVYPALSAPFSEARSLQLFPTKRSPSTTFAEHFSSGMARRLNSAPWPQRPRGRSKARPGPARLRTGFGGRSHAARSPLPRALRRPDRGSLPALHARHARARCHLELTIFVLLASTSFPRREGQTQNEKSAAAYLLRTTLPIPENAPTRLGRVRKNRACILVFWRAVPRGPALALTVFPRLFPQSTLLPSLLSYSPLVACFPG
jgi:hypothetical protein